MVLKAWRLQKIDLTFVGCCRSFSSLRAHDWGLQMIDLSSGEAGTTMSLGARGLKDACFILWMISWADVGLWGLCCLCMKAPVLIWPIWLKFAIDGAAPEVILKFAQLSVVLDFGSLGEVCLAWHGFGALACLCWAPRCLAQVIALMLRAA